MADRKRFNHQTKSQAKTELLSSIYNCVNAFPALEVALKNNSLNDDQWGHLRYFSDQINKASSTVKALGIKSELSGEVQKLITEMDILGNTILNLKPIKEEINKLSKAGKIESQTIAIRLYQTMKTNADEVNKLGLNAKNLADKLRKEFDKKKYLIF